MDLKRILKVAVGTAIPGMALGNGCLFCKDDIVYYYENNSKIRTVENNQSDSEQIEASHALYHKNVAGIQLEAQRLKQETREENRAELDHYVESHLDEDAGEIMEKFTKILEVNILKIRQEAALQIASELDALRDRIQSILRHS